MALPRVFTIPASAPFVPTLIRALMDGTAGAGLSAGERSARARGRDALPADAARLPAGARRFPRRDRRAPRSCRASSPIGDLDEDEIAFAQAATGALAADALDLPTALGGLERRLLLAQLVLQWAATPDARTNAEAPLVAATRRPRSRSPTTSRGSWTT